jgi:RNA polymerase sigma factor (sigma-70 family)
VSTDRDILERPAGTGRPWVPAGRSLADLDRFWTGYEPSLRRYAGHLLNYWRIPTGRADVDDVTNDVYVDLRANWPTVRLPIGYARGRARAAVFAALRTEEHCGRSLSEGADDGEDGFDIAQPGPGIEDELVEREIEARLAEALPAAMDTLSPQQRKAVELTTSGEGSYAEAGAAMGIEPGTVSSHRARGLLKLANILTPVLGLVAVVAHEIVRWLISRT